MQLSIQFTNDVKQRLLYHPTPNTCINTQSMTFGEKRFYAVSVGESYSGSSLSGIIGCYEEEFPFVIGMCSMIAILFDTELDISEVLKSD